LYVNSNVTGLDPGVYIIITIFGDFSQFTAKKKVFFSKTNVMIKFLQKLAVVLSKKRQYFRQIFRRKYLKIITSVPGHTGLERNSLILFAAEDLLVRS
jgi:hypothetical protein